MFNPGEESHSDRSCCVDPLFLRPGTVFRTIAVKTTTDRRGLVDDSLDNTDGIDRQLELLSERSEQLFLECRLQSALRVAQEARRTAKTHGRVVNYMHALFDTMRFGHGLLDPQMTREAAVELIMLLQDEEQARRIQPDLDEGQYQWTCAWMSSCAYDNLAESTGMMSGYNSPGMHECINEGIQVCRQTGKTECIQCFREYAADVYLAGDDLPMVQHQCQLLLDYREEEESRDRRWTAHEKLAWIYLMEGRLQKARSELEASLEVCQSEKVYNRLGARSLLTTALQEVQLLLGEEVDIETSPLGDDFPMDEFPHLELDRAKVKALHHSVAGEFDQAIAILTDLDRRLTESKCLKDWFEVRLRLIAAYLMSGNRKRAEALSRGLEARALEAQDHFTVRRWKRLMHPETIVSPIPLLAPADSGPFGSGIIEEGADSTEEPSASLTEWDDEGDDEIVEAKTPLSEALTEYMQRIMASAEDESAKREILNSLLSHAPEDVVEAGDGAYLVHLSRYVVQGTEDAERVWEWATRMRKRFPEDAVMLSVVASLGQFFRNADAETFENRISVTELEQWVRLSLTLNPNHPRNFARAGAFFLEIGLPGDAEQCFARSFRLDRTDGSVAHQLADIYRETERPRDALAVLDLCLRKGTTDANVAWEAAMTALQLSQFDMLLTYLNRYRELAGKAQAWFHYYRGLALFRLGKHEECLQELEEELKYNPPGQMHLHVIRVCALDQLGRTNEARSELEEFLKLRFVDVDYLSLHGLVRLAETLCDTIQEWTESDPLRRRTVLRLLKAGLISDDYLQTIREKRTESGGVKFFRVQVRQPLDESWPHSEGCLSGQQDWDEYLIDWGVLAKTEEDAVRYVMELQNECESAAAEVVQIDAGEENFRERPGVVWQGYRRHSDSHSPGHDHDHDHDGGDDDESD